MRIVLHIDSNMLKEYDTPVRTPVFMIALEQDGEFYPSDTWTDFGVVILGWWIVAFLHLLQEGNPQQFVFMDGPYRVGIQLNPISNRVELRPQGRHVVWEVSSNELADNLVRAAATVLHELDRAGVAGEGEGRQARQALEQGIHALAETLK